MNKLAVSALRDALCEDLESARLRLKELNADELKQLQRACMSLYNLVGARLYAVAQNEALLGMRRQVSGGNFSDS